MNFWILMICFWIVMLGAVVVELIWKWREEQRPTDIEQATEEDVAVMLAEKPEVEPSEERNEEMHQVVEHALPEARV
jgi:hypothetical protein